MEIVKLYDTTLRDGSQTEGIAFSVEDKLQILHKLDSFGIDYIEGGWPGTNPKDISFFDEARKQQYHHARLVAFGSTHHPQFQAENDPNLNTLLAVHTPTICIFGKSWDLHVKNVLHIPLSENLRIIANSVAYLKKGGVEVIFDAEHFFDGYKQNREYALAAIKSAYKGGADTVVLCDTNGGTLPHEVSEIINDVLSNFNIPLGIHAHNDSEVAVANSIAAVMKGCRHLQGTINGYGERCGNANLCSIIPNIQLKLPFSCSSNEHLAELTELSNFIAEVANLAFKPHQPFVGSSAFTHKAGIHIDAVKKHPGTYEHISPEVVGNIRNILISELSGQTAILHKAQGYGLKIEKGSPELKRILQHIKECEHQGYQFEAAEASLELLMRRLIKQDKPVFMLGRFEVIVESRDGIISSDAIIKLRVQGKGGRPSGQRYIVAEGDGPIHALDNALKKALGKDYPIIRKIRLTDYKVRVLDSKEGTASKVRVLIESSLDGNQWRTIGVSENIIKASWDALVDSIEYILLKRGCSPGD